MYNSNQFIYEYIWSYNKAFYAWWLFYYISRTLSCLNLISTTFVVLDEVIWNQTHVYYTKTIMFSSVLKAVSEKYIFSQTAYHYAAVILYNVNEIAWF